MDSYPKFGSIARLHREITITEKIDGTNGLIDIEEHEFGEGIEAPANVVAITFGSETDESGDPLREYWVRAGSRNRWISVLDDNAGFARWVDNNRQSLVADLGPGRHYGEWWGSGIQRGYGLPKGQRIFSLFNVSRWTTVEQPDRFSIPYVTPVAFLTPGLNVVPVILWKGDADVLNEHVRMCLGALRLAGSQAAPGFKRPEGIVIYHHAANQLFKVTLDNDDVPKKVAAQRSKGALEYAFDKGANDGIQGSK